ncbi:MAG: glutathione S-transferase family protein [Reyranella sp.]|uniref:glutathione S-transferase family protein n=1 Tax=Reyranella sp. TaxID=1929291 RepID=UPI001ACD7979|nr:glutathione S-transferase family protein [Reyranella sp.]MBN9086990.1 glutathione S-transferase family protein [Reyranella sp.]
MLTLYDFMGSGNGYKVRLLLAQLGLEYTLVERDILKGETRTPEFLAKNPNGRIPTLQLEDGTHLAESDAILWYLAEGTRFAPETRLERAQTLQWMFFEQYSHEPYIAVARFWKHFFAKLTPQQEIELPSRMEKGYAALGVMERHLARNRFFVGDRYGIADIALYGYTHVACEGDFNLDNFPQVNAWLARVADEPGHVIMEHKN